MKMNEQDKKAFEEAFANIFDWGYSEELCRQLWQAALEYARQPAEPVAWQFKDSDGKWYYGDDRIKDHRKNTESDGYEVRDLYTKAQPAPDVQIHYGRTK